MSLTLIKEDGTGKVDANSYASLADCDAFHSGHLYATVWTGATADQKAVALVMATRLIDAEYQFSGFKATENQALQWPRMNCPDPDKTPVPVLTSLMRADPFVPPGIVPKALVQATCEMARELLIADRTAAPAGEGLKYQNIGGNQTGYDKTDRRPIISPVAQALLDKFGSMIKSGSGAVRLVRT